MSQPAGELVEHFFRHESANLIAVLCRAFGLARIDLVEDMVQAAMLEAMHAWKQGGVPKNPAGWIHTVAKNRILDVLRREAVHQRAMALAGQTQESSESLLDQWLEDDRVPDSLLRMMFVCCHPILARQSQIALTLKILGGFGIREIASGLLMPEETIKKRLQRAKRKLAAEQITLELPSSSEMQNRLNVVHDVLYLMFNEGYSTSHGTDPIRDDLCEEAARLCHMLCEHRVGNHSTCALLALMLFHAARLDSRIDKNGAVVLLEDQDRSIWDQNLICIGKRWLRRCGDPTSRFHLEAGIAMLHCQAASVESTDWTSIVHLYNRLIEIVDSPIYRLNRAIACGQAGEVETGLSELEIIRHHPKMSDYFLLDCAEARLHELNDDRSSAIDSYLRAMANGMADHQRTLLESKIKGLSGGKR